MFPERITAKALPVISRKKIYAITAILQINSIVTGKREYSDDTLRVSGNHIRNINGRSHNSQCKVNV